MNGARPVGTEVRDAVVVVTGGAMGIGLASAEAFARAGARAVVIADIDRDAARAAVARVEALGVAVRFVETDVSDHHQVATVLDRALSEFGCLDVLHNNAGIVSGLPMWPETPIERIEQVVRVNVLGVMYGTRLGVERMSSRGGGAIVNTASIVGLTSSAHDAVYAATKAAVIHLTTSCAGLALSHGVRVNAVLPAATDTAILAKTGDGTRPADWLAPALSANMPIAAEQVADVVVELAASREGGQAVAVQ